MLAVCLIAAAVTWGGWMLIRVLLMLRERREQADRDYFMRTFGKERDAL